MHKEKLEYLRSKWPMDEISSGILIQDIARDGSCYIGMPILIRVGSFTPFINSDERGPTYLRDASTRFVAKDLMELDMDLASEIVAYSLSKAQILIPFATMKGNYDAVELTVQGASVYLRKEKPLIYDNGKIIESNGRLSDIIDKKNLGAIDSFVDEYLSKYRYLTIILTNLAQSKRSDILEDANRLINALSKSYPQHKGYAQCTDSPGVLIDVMSVSFFRLQDAIPIYDAKRMKGVLVEFFLTSSVVKGQLILVKSSTYRFIFAKNKDGIFYIDGEKISRPCETSIEKCMSYIGRDLSDCMPNDLFLKRTISKEE